MNEICFYSCLLSYYMLINVDYTITYFLPIPSTVPRTRARSELLNVSLVPPRVEFYTALLYRLLAATNSGSLLPFDYTWILLSQTEPT